MKSPTLSSVVIQSKALRYVSHPRSMSEASPPMTMNVEGKADKTMNLNRRIANCFGGILARYIPKDGLCEL